MKRVIAGAGLVLLVFLFLALPLPRVAARAAKDESLARTYPVPKNMYVFHVSREGVLGFVPDPRNRGAGCAGFSCTLYRSPALGAKFKPVKTFSRVNMVFNGPCSHQGTADMASSLAFVWAKKQENFALYVSTDAGRTWKTVPGTERDSPCPPFVVVLGLVNPHQAYVIPAEPTTPFYGRQPLSLHRFLETKDGGVTWEQRSLPGKTPPAVEGLLFHPEEPNKMWVWRGSMGNWTGVCYSEDGGLTWKPVEEIYGGGRISGVVFNPFTGELLVTGRQVISRWYNGKGEDLRDKCSLSSSDFEAGPPLLDVRGKEVLIPVGNAVYACRNGNVSKLAVFPASLLSKGGSLVYAFLSGGKLYLSFMNVKGQGQVLEYPLPAASALWRWLVLGGVLVLAVLGGFLLRRRTSTTRPE